MITKLKCGSIENQIEKNGDVLQKVPSRGSTTMDYFKQLKGKA